MKVAIAQMAVGDGCQPAIGKLLAVEAVQLLKPAFGNGHITADFCLAVGGQELIDR